MPTPLPLRVLVKGASTVNWISWMGGPRADLTFPRAMEAQLLAQDRPCEVRTITMPSEQTSTILRTWQREILGYSPDVIVLVYGHFETIHLFLPRWLERHANSLRTRPGRLTSAYRKRVLRPVWMMLAKAQARLDTLVDPTIRRRRPQRVAADLRQYISHVRKIGSPMVIVFELLPPANKYRAWFPGMAARMAVMNRQIETMVESFSEPDVRYFRVSELVDRHCAGDLDVATPDGFHYTPELHGAIGNALAGMVDDWARTQEHLQDPTETR